MTTHPVDFPPGPHFSPLIGGTHSSGVAFWAPGALASDGIEAMAERGNPGPLAGEVEAERFPHLVAHYRRQRYQQRCSQPGAGGG